jgi:hypothetical protein
MATIVASDLIRSSLRLIGVMSQGEFPSSDETTDALAVLNDILDEWYTQNLMVFRNENDTYTLVPGQQSYTLGSGGVFSGNRPTAIEQAFVTYGGIDFNVRILTTHLWNEIALKSFQAPLPSALYYIDSYPLGNLYIWPVPSLALPITLSLNAPFTTYAATDTISLPPGYLKALRYTLAVEIAPEYGVQPSPLILKAQKEVIGDLKSANRQMPVAKFDPSITGREGVGLAGFLGGY